MNEDTPSLAKREKETPDPIQTREEEQSGRQERDKPDKG